MKFLWLDCLNRFVATECVNGLWAARFTVADLWCLLTRYDFPLQQIQIKAAAGRQNKQHGDIPCSFFNLLKAFPECLFNWLLIYPPLRPAGGAGQLGLLTQHVWWSFLLAPHSSSHAEQLSRSWRRTLVGNGRLVVCSWWVQAYRGVAVETQKQVLNEIHQTDDKLNSLISVDTRRCEIWANALSRTEGPHLPLYGGSDDTIGWVWSDSVRAP